MATTSDKHAWLEQARAARKNTALDHLDIEVIDVGDDFITLRMPITDKARQPMGLLHGGVNMVLAETAASLHATWGIDLREKAPVGIEINGSHVRSASEGAVRAEARVVRRSRNFIFHQVDIFHEESGELLSTGRVTNYYRPMKAE
jgi:uncharacterized protein (TIGR00369 family)